MANGCYIWQVKSSENQQELAVQMANKTSSHGDRKEGLKLNGEKKQDQLMLTSLLEGVSHTVIGNTDKIKINNIWCDSRKATPGSLFVCLSGARYDGHEFAADAIKLGASALMVEHRLDLACPQIVVENTRKSLAKIAVNFYNHPYRDLTLMGVTGTNGKTTIVHMLKSIMGQVALSAMIGTIGVKIGEGDYFATGNTTPESLELQFQLRKMADQGVAYVAAEVSSQGLAKYRFDHSLVDAAIFTNLTWDHMDYHKTMEHYFACKAKLFQQIKPGGIAVINIDDPYGQKLTALTKGRLVTYSLQKSADCTAAIIERQATGTKIKFCLGEDSFEVVVPILFDYNVYNALAAAATAWGLGISPEVIRVGLEQLHQVPGRMEKVDFGQNYGIFIDFAHTPDALEKVLKGLKNLVKKRLIVVFGCVGNGDRDKRPQMAAIAEGYGDTVIVTSTQPKYEDPDAIIDEIIQGFSGNNYIRIVQREQAVEKALSVARAGDIVILAGFGHQKYKLMKGKATPYSDFQAVAGYFLKAAQQETAGTETI
ncbi:MAG TPA: UDP-N-acetylmuramoyl-L-alanyl-D-glutamate--2,6-diaminopimelate ligase [Firmicutes bacterium]|nr:UDP-N-acetylmuramoyl-L-alanyl-D-glutamate--2,6-diaminopimelate ligase [Bacillota bacterium]